MSGRKRSASAPESSNESDEAEDSDGAGHAPRLMRLQLPPAAASEDTNDDGDGGIQAPIGDEDLSDCGDDGSDVDAEEGGNPGRRCPSCGNHGHGSRRSQLCPNHRPSVFEFMAERAQLGPNERLKRRTVKSTLNAHTRHGALREQIERVAIGFTGVRVALLMILKVLLRANPEAMVPILAEKNRLYQLMHMMNTAPANRIRALNRLPLDLHPLAILLIEEAQPYRYDLSAHPQAVKEVSDQLAVNIKNHLQVQISKRLVSYITSELDRPAADDAESVRLMETSTGGTFAKKQALEIVSALQERRYSIHLYVILIMIQIAHLILLGPHEFTVPSSASRMCRVACDSRTVFTQSTTKF